MVMHDGTFDTMYKAPPSLVSGGTSELWIPLFGILPYDKPYTYPPYLPLISSVISHDEYRNLMEKLVVLFEQHRPTEGSFLRQMVALVLAVITAGILSCGFIYYWYWGPWSLNKKVEEIVKSTGKPNLRAFVCKNPRALRNVPELRVVDTRGNCLMMSADDENGNSELVPMWPPIGFGVVISLPHDVPWPPNAP